MRNQVLFVEVMPKRSKTASEKKRDPRVAEIMKLINQARPAKGLDNDEDFAKAAGKGVSTWYGWQNGSRSPMYVDLDDFAQAVGLNVGVVEYGGSVHATEGSNLTTEQRQLITILDGLPQHVQQDILEIAERHSKRWSAGNPQQAVAADRATDDRNK